MSKKRVHEVAKELKAHGIELDNKEVVTELVSLGYDVKSHSSSLEDDQANAAVQAILAKRNKVVAPAPVAAKGFVVRRKPGVPDAPPPAAVAPPRAPEPEPAPVVAAPPPFVAQPVVAPAPLPPEPLTVPVAVAPVAVPALVTALPPVLPAPPASAAPVAPLAAASVSAFVPPAVARPGAAVVVRPPPVGTTPAVPGLAPRTTVDPRQQRPTATQAVVLSRPIIQVRRVTPSSQAHKSIPLAPGKKAIGEVREFKVVPDHLGRGRELVDVTKNKEARGKGKRTDATTESTYKQEVQDLVWGRVSIPLRGKKKKPTKKGQKTQITEMAGDKKIIRLQDGITVSDLSQRMGVKTSALITKLMASGAPATANQMLDVDTATIMATDYGWKVEKVGFEVEQHLPDNEDKPEDIATRPPVVTVMGHVDHGKTSLLDAIRHANVAAGEAGGITQHIGAYTVQTPKGKITFLDTPGHEAFTAMRARGATVTDIVILVVGADDGVMPQTLEAISHAKAAEVPIIVAINKIDVAGANPERIKKDLADKGLLAEDWGGDTIMVPVSAKTKQGLDLLLENLGLQAEVLDLKANPNKSAVGTIIEAKLEKGRGPVATVLVQDGTLKLGDAVVSGTHYGRVRAMRDDKGVAVKELSPGYCAEVLGLSGVPTAGDTLNVVADDGAAKEIADHRTTKARQADVGKTSKESLEGLLNRMKSGEQKQLRLVLKADVQGSLEAVANAVTKLATHKVAVDIIHKGVGPMTESDVMLAAASKGAVVGFSVKGESGFEATAKAQGVQLWTYNIIYELIDGVRDLMQGLLEPIRTERKLGRAEVRNLFNVPKLGTVAGAAVLDGTIKRTAMARLMRENKAIYTGKIASLKRFKDDVREVEKGFECGIGVENYSDFKPGDIIEVYEIEETRPSLN